MSATIKKQIKLNQNKNSAIIIGLSANPELAEAVAKNLNMTYENIEQTIYSDGEKTIKINLSVRSRTVFIIQSTNLPTSENIVEVLLTIDAAHRAAASEIILVMPYVGYSRQDRRVEGRQPISAKLFASLYEKAGATQLITFDLHSDQIEGFFEIPLTHLKAHGILYKEFKKVYPGKPSDKNLVVVSPDHGGVSRARQFAKHSGTQLAIIDKRRTGPNQIEAINILGDVKGKNAVIVDDIIDTGKTIESAIKLLKKSGSKNIYVVATHPILSRGKDKKNNPIALLKKAGLEKLITTNSVKIVGDYDKNFVKVTDLSKSISLAIRAHQNYESITETFIKKYNTTL